MTQKEEIEANQFAMELLMPKSFIKSEIRKIRNKGFINRERLIEKMAKKFKVGEEAMAGRLYNLGYIMQL